MVCCQFKVYVQKTEEEWSSGTDILEFVVLTLLIKSTEAASSKCHSGIICQKVYSWNFERTVTHDGFGSNVGDSSLWVVTHQRVTRHQWQCAKGDKKKKKNGTSKCSLEYKTSWTSCVDTSLRTHALWTREQRQQACIVGVAASTTLIIAPDEIMPVWTEAKAIIERATNSLTLNLCC